MMMLAFAPNALVMPASGMRTPTMAASNVQMMSTYAEYVAAKNTAAAVPLPEATPLFKTGYEDYMQKRMDDAAAASPSTTPTGFEEYIQVQAVEPAAAPLSQYEMYMQSRGMATPAAAPVVPEAPAPPSAQMSAYEEYVAMRSAAEAPPVAVEPPAVTGYEAYAAPAALSAYEEYMQNRDAEATRDAAATVAPVAPEAAVPIEEAAVPMSAYDEYRKMRAAMDAPVAAAPAAPAAAPAPAASLSPYEAYVKSRGAAAAKEVLRTPSFASTDSSMWDSDMAIVEFVVDGVPKKYRIMQ